MSKQQTSEKYLPRIAIFGIGFLGKMVTRLAHESGWQIVAAYNRAGEKVGQELGALAELDTAIGVIVEDYEAADYNRLDADIAIVAGPDRLDDCFPIYEKFLKAGVNVLSFGTHAYQPSWFCPDIAKKIEALALENGVTFTGSGLWDTTRIWSGILLGGASVRIDSLSYTTRTDIAPQGQHWLRKMGVGMSVSEFDEKIGRDVGSLTETVQVPMVMVLQYFGYDISEVKLTQEPVVYDEPVACEGLDDKLPAGICSGTRILVEIETIQGVKGKNCFEYCVLRPQDTECATWKITGKPSMEMTINREDSGVASAASLLNRVPQVLAARPGIVTILEMGPEKPGALMAI